MRWGSLGVFSFRFLLFFVGSCLWWCFSPSVPLTDCHGCHVAGNRLLPDCKRLKGPGTHEGDNCIRINVPNAGRVNESEFPFSCLRWHAHSHGHTLLFPSFCLCCFLFFLLSLRWVIFLAVVRERIVSDYDIIKSVKRPVPLS